MFPAPRPRRARDARAIAATCAWLSACEAGAARYTGCPPDDGYRPWTEHDVFPIDLRRAVALPHTVLVPADGAELNAPLLRELRVDVDGNLTLNPVCPDLRADTAARLDLWSGAPPPPLPSATLRRLYDPHTFVPPPHAASQVLVRAQFDDTELIVAWPSCEVHAIRAPHPSIPIREWPVQLIVNFPALEPGVEMVEDDGHQVRVRTQRASAVVAATPPSPTFEPFSPHTVFHRPTVANPGFTLTPPAPNLSPLSGARVCRDGKPELLVGWGGERPRVARHTISPTESALEASWPLPQAWTRIHAPPGTERVLVQLDPGRPCTIDEDPQSPTCCPVGGDVGKPYPWSIPPDFAATRSSMFDEAPQASKRSETRRPPRRTGHPSLGEAMNASAMHPPPPLELAETACLSDGPPLASTAATLDGHRPRPSIAPIADQPGIFGPTPEDPTVWFWPPRPPFDSPAHGAWARHPEPSSTILRVPLPVPVRLDTAGEPAQLTPVAYEIEAAHDRHLLHGRIDTHHRVTWEIGLRSVRMVGWHVTATADDGAVDLSDDAQPDPVRYQAKPVPIPPPPLPTTGGSGGRVGGWSSGIGSAWRSSPWMNTESTPWLAHTPFSTIRIGERQALLLAVTGYGAVLFPPGGLDLRGHTLVDRATIEAGFHAGMVWTRGEHHFHAWDPYHPREPRLTLPAAPSLVPGGFGLDGRCWIVRPPPVLAAPPERTAP